MITSLIVAASGNVGIGTVAPGFKTEIMQTSAGSSATPLLLRNNSSSDGTSVRLGFAPINESLGVLAIEGIRVGSNNNQMAFHTWGATGQHEVMRLDQNGNVGIGTTAPTSTLSVIGSGYIQGRATTTHSLVVGEAVGEEAVGDVNISGSYHTNGADYAEYFFTKDIGLQPGEAVCVDITENNAVKRCLRGADPDLIGIVSTNPSVIGNNRLSADKNSVIIGLIGQVPAKASAENGAIRPGDSLTSASSTPGYIMKANAGDSTVGVALEGLNSDTGTINVLISRRNKSLTVEQVEEEVTKRVADMKIEDEVNLMVFSAMDNLGVDAQIEELTNQVLEGKSKLEVMSAKLSGAEEKFSLDTDGTVRIFADVAVEGSLTVKDKITAESAEAQTGSFQELVLGETDGFIPTGFSQGGDATTSPEGGENSKKQVKITVQDDSSGEVRMVVSGGAEFGGTVKVMDLEINGRVTVYDRATFKKDVAMEANLELAGAIIKNFVVATDTVLAVGDAVFVSSGGRVDRAYADNPAFKPAIGVVVETQIETDAQMLEGNNTDSRRLVRVAIGGTVRGFSGLIPGAKYYLSELGYYYETRVAQTTSTDPIILAGLNMDEPKEIGSAIQPMAVAADENELLIMPSLSYEFVGGKEAATDFNSTYKEQQLLELEKEILNDQQTINSDSVLLEEEQTTTEGESESQEATSETEQTTNETVGEEVSEEASEETNTDAGVTEEENVLESENINSEEAGDLSEEILASEQQVLMVEPTAPSGEVVVAE